MGRGETHMEAGWYPDPWRPGAARWWNGRAWTDRLAEGSEGMHGVQRADRRSTLEQLRWVVGITVMVGSVAALIAFILAPRFGDDTWRARVITVSGSRVCTTPDRGEKDPGWADPFCFDEGLRTETGKHLEARVGDCVELESKHPGFHANKVVACATPGSP